MKFSLSKFPMFRNKSDEPKILKELRREQMSKFGVKPRCWKADFDKSKSIFIHIPKAAGTSISQSLYGENTFHFTADTYQFLPAREFHEYFKFAFVRNPYERILSTYKYSFKQYKEHPKTSVAFVTRFTSFEDFVLNWINKKNINNHYFFNTQKRYVSDGKGKLLVDYVGRFETLSQDFRFVAQKLGKKVQIEHVNKSPERKEKLLYSESMAELVYKAYKPDFELFQYGIDSWKSIY